MNQNKSLLRIVNDIMSFKKNQHKKIHIWVNKKNVKVVYAMIIGPNGTPYQNGMYFFEFIFPDNYPFNPPSVQFLTTNNLVRFNPNLYEKGKVCLSILGTWPGPKWTPSMTLESILLSLQSLLQENPLINEPGYQNYKPDNEKCINYNNYLTYWNLKLAIVDVYNKKSFQKLRDKFSDEIKTHLKENIQEIINDTLSYQLLLNNHIILPNVYFLKEQIIYFNDIEKDLHKIKKIIEK